MTKVSDLQRRIQSAIQRIDAEIEAQAHKAGLDIVALVTNRVVQKGETSDGGSFTPYSTKGVPAFFYLGRGRTGSSDNVLKRKSKNKELVSYKEFRAINNLNTSPKNFEFTGEMWRGFSVVSVQKIGPGVRITIGGKTQDAADKITWNSALEKRSIIRPSQKEIEIVKNNLTRWVQSLVDGRTV